MFTTPQKAIASAYHSQALPIYHLTYGTDEL